MNKWIALITLNLFLTPAFAKIRIENVDFNTSQNSGIVTIHFKGPLHGSPDLSFRDDLVQIQMKNATVWPQINRDVRLMSSNDDTKLMAYQFDKNTARVRAIVPFNIADYQDQVELKITDGKMILTIPKLTQAAAVKVDRAPNPVIAANQEPAKNKKTIAQNLDENYLNKLIADIDDKKPTDSKLAPVKPNDSVKTAQAAPVKEAKSSFSLANYAGKFIAFLGFVLLLFYGVVHILRKGVTGKGKLNFLGSTKQVEVLNSTYVGPKKSLMLVRVHKQVFLVSSTENGMSLISEIQDPANVIKGDISDISGTNFDLQLNAAVSNEKLDDKVKLKAENNGNDDLAKFLKEGASRQPSKSKFSDQIKKKVKGLKPLQ